MDRRIYFGEVFESVITGSNGGWARDITRLVDPDGAGHISDSVSFSKNKIAVDKYGVGERGSWLIECPLANSGDIFVERDGQNNKPRIFQLIKKCLPDRQIIATASPRRPRQQQPFTAGVVVKAYLVAVNVG